MSYLIFFDSEKTLTTPEELLAEVETEQLINYLALSDITTEEIVENLDFKEIDLVFESAQSDLFESPELDELEYFLEDGFEVNEL